MTAIASVAWIVVLKAWAWVSPFLGGLVLRGRNWLPGVSWGGYVVPALALAVVAFIGWRAWAIASSPTPRMVTIEAVEANRLAAQLAAERRAREIATNTLSERELAMEAQDAEINRLTAALEMARANSNEIDPRIGSDGVLDANDPWVRDKRQR
jgi:hypothetical protein